MTSQLYIEWVARGFFVWLSVFNLFVVSIFWSFMADLFTPGRARAYSVSLRRAGAPAHSLAPCLPPASTYVPRSDAHAGLGSVVGGLHGLHLQTGDLESCAIPDPSCEHRGTAGRQFARGIAWYGRRPTCLASADISLLTMTATFLYLEQVRLVAERVSAPEARTRLFATLDFVTNVLTWLTQILITNRLVGRFGLVAALLFLPFISLVGFLGIALWPGLVVYVSFSVLRRVGGIRIVEPAREVLFTVVSREEKYKAKNFIDTAVSRGGGLYRMAGVGN